MANLKDLIVSGVSRFIGNTYIANSTITTINGSTVGSNPKFTDTHYTASTVSITPVTKKTVVTSASGGTAAVSNGVLTITNGSYGTGDSVTVGSTVKVVSGITAS